MLIVCPAAIGLLFAGVARRGSLLGLRWSPDFIPPRSSILTRTAHTKFILGCGNAVATYCTAGCDGGGLSDSRQGVVPGADLSALAEEHTPAAEEETPDVVPVAVLSVKSSGGGKKRMKRVRQSMPADGCEAIKDEMIGDGLKSYQDCPICKKDFGILCRIANHPSKPAAATASGKASSLLYHPTPRTSSINILHNNLHTYQYRTILPYTFLTLYLHYCLFVFSF